MDDPMPEERSSGGSSDSESSDSEMEADVNLSELEAALAAQPDNYETHVQYVSSLRKMGEIDKLRAARQAMSLLFPLSGEMWQQWTKDEANYGNSDISTVEALYERGVAEYLYIPLWIDYLEFVEERDMAVAQCTPDGLTKMRALCERAITAVGLHIFEGSKVWDAYREFEDAVLVAMAGQDEKEIAKQSRRVRSLFHRQLSIPLINHEATLEEYVRWEKDQGVNIGNGDDPLAGLDPTVLSAYKKAVAACAEYAPFEERIQAGKPVDADLLQSCLLYISYVENKSGSDPARVQLLFERTITLFPVTADVWLKYTAYLDQKLKIAGVCLNVYGRAVRNCPWVEELWRKYLLALERFKRSEEELSLVFEQAIQKSFQTPNEYLSLFLTRIDGLRRQDATPERLRGSFQRASEFLATYFPDFVDRSLQLHGYWARVEARLCKDVEAARAVWEGVLKTSGSATEAWQGYIGMETELGNYKAAQKLYKRCYNKRLDGEGSAVICLAWLQFEREYGTLEDFDTASLKVSQRLQDIQSSQLVQETKESAREHTRFKPETRKKHEDSKRKRGKDVKESKKKQKRPPKHVPEMPEPDKPTAEEPTKQGPAPPEVPVQRAPSDAPKQRAAPRRENFKPRRVHNDELTVFVSNLDPETTVDGVERFFASCGGLKEVRLLKDRYTGRSRGLAYVDFDSEEHLAAAVGMNKKKLGDRRLSVARSDPASKGKKKSVRPLGWTGGREEEAQASNADEEAPKSNVEFRNLLLKK